MTDTLAEKKRSETMSSIRSAGGRSSLCSKLGIRWLVCLAAKSRSLTTAPAVGRLPAPRP